MIDVFFSHQNPSDAYCRMQIAENKAIHMKWVGLLYNPDVDASTQVMELQRLTGKPVHAIRQARLAVYAMDHLPLLRLIQEHYFFLDINYLATIMREVGKADPTLYGELDARIVDVLTPQFPGEVLTPAPVLAKLIVGWIKELDPTFQPVAKAQEFLDLRHHNGRVTIKGVLNEVDGKRLVDALGTADDAHAGLLALLESTTHVNVIQHLYTPLTGGVSWMPGVGALTPEQVEGLAPQIIKTLNLDEVACRVEAGHTPSPRLKAYVAGRDGCCRHPGCVVQAKYCQYDHVVPFDQGGPTVPWNLMLLCQRHHNMKTDGRITASIGYLGEVTWTGPCEEDMITTPTGPLAQEMPTGTWGQTVRAMMEQYFTRLRKEHTRE